MPDLLPLGLMDLATTSQAGPWPWAMQPRTCQTPTPGIHNPSPHDVGRLGDLDQETQAHPGLPSLGLMDLVPTAQVGPRTQAPLDTSPLGSQTRYTLHSWALGPGPASQHLFPFLMFSGGFHVAALQVEWPCLWKFQRGHSSSGQEPHDPCAISDSL